MRSIKFRFGRRIRVAALGIAASIALTACGGSTSSVNNSTQEAEQAQTASDMTAKVLTIAVDDAIVKDWDPGASYGDDARIYCCSYEQLLRFNDQDGSFSPWLADSYETSEDGYTWTFHLHPGIKFHDGTEMTAEAVKKCFERTIAVNKGGSFVWGPVDSFTAVDDYTLEIKLKYLTDLRTIVSCQYAAYVYSVAACGGDLAESENWFHQYNICGTGPYVLKEFVDGSCMILTKFEDYWRGWDGNHIETVVFRQADESSVRRQMVEGNEADIALRLNYDDAEALSSNDALVCNVVDGTGNLLAFFNTEYGPCADKVVRQALAYSFPYDDCINKLFYGKYATMPLDMVCQANQVGRTESIPYHYDLAKAEELLKEAGAENITVSVSYNSASELTKKVLELWQSELTKIGVTMKIEPNGFQLAFDRAMSKNPEERADIYMQETGADTSNAYSSYSSSCETGGSWNFSGFGEAYLDEMIENANMTKEKKEEKW